MNLPQKSVVVGWALLGVTVLFLHNPISGFEGVYSEPPLVIETPVWDSSRGECASSSLQEWQAFNQYEEMKRAQENIGNKQIYDAYMKKTSRHQRLTGLCVTWDRRYGEPQLQSIQDWRSAEPYVSWLRSATAVLWAEACIAAVALIALLVLRGKPTSV